MSVLRLLLARRTWLGVATALLLMALCLALGALLLLRELLPLTAALPWVCGSWGLSAFLGARLALRGREEGTLPAALAVAAPLYLLLWGLGLSLGGAAFAHGGAAITAALLAGTVLAGLLRPRRRKKRNTARRPAIRR